ncbi:hypothetical protein [Absidia glauca]|uniref:Uncharacterized protein n=1 Tax=Absidia glauca TaxID=4829 RepID=A0A168KSX4_ABSGL|nr:hypothetical protein [Absidia glauca]
MSAPNESSSADSSPILPAIDIDQFWANFSDDDDYVLDSVHEQETSAPASEMSRKRKIDDAMLSSDDDTSIINDDGNEDFSTASDPGHVYRPSFDVSASALSTSSDEYVPSASPSLRPRQISSLSFDDDDDSTHSLALSDTHVDHADQDADHVNNSGETFTLLCNQSRINKTVYSQLLSPSTSASRATQSSVDPIAEAQPPATVLSLREFNGRIAGTVSPLEFISASVSGYFSSGEAVSVGLTYPSPRIATTFYDLDSLGMYTIDLPSAGSMKLYINPFAYKSVSTKIHFGKSIDDKVYDINRMPNFAIGEFGDLGRFNVHICFPGYIKEIQQRNEESTSNNGPRRKSNMVSQGDVRFFTDKVLLPALRDAHFGSSNPHYASLVNNYPQSHLIATESMRGRNGQTTVLKKTVDREILNDLVYKMEDRIALLSPSRRCLFESFFFYTFAHGLKKMFSYGNEDSGAESMIKSLFPDILFPADLSDVFVDIAAVFVAENVNGPTTGLWLQASPNDAIAHRPLLHSFLGSSLQKKGYKVNPFGHFKSVCGFNYVAGNIVCGDGSLGIRKIQAYHTIKTQFEYRASSWRHNRGTTVGPSDLWMKAKKLETTTKNFQQACADASGMNFGARLEFRVSLADAIAHRRQYLQILRNLPANTIHFEDTSSLLQFFANRYSSATLVSDNLSRQLLKPEPFDRMTATIFAASIINTITSTANASEEFASEVRKKLSSDLREESDLMFWKSVIVATNDGNITSAFSASKNVVVKIFGQKGMDFDKRHRLQNPFSQSSMRPLMDQQLANDVVELSHVEDNAATTTITTNITAPQPFDHILQPENALFRLPLASGLKLPLNVQLILSIFVRNGLNVTAVNLFLEAWAEEFWRKVPKELLQSGVSVESLKLCHFSSLDMLQSVIKVKLYLFKFQ